MAYLTVIGTALDNVAIGFDLHPEKYTTMYYRTNMCSSTVRYNYRLRVSADAESRLLRRGMLLDGSGIVVSKSPKRPLVHLLPRTRLPVGQLNCIKTSPGGVTIISDWQILPRLHNNRPSVTSDWLGA